MGGGANGPAPLLLSKALAFGVSAFLQ
ncbi:MAG: hypothetical protein QOF83_2046, partial [Solirubrobacteraceae bacterium]|nr:hypothetical protein [Solirubrobacteraceae bacterium]